MRHAAIYLQSDNVGVLITAYEKREMCSRV